MLCKVVYSGLHITAQVPRLPCPAVEGGCGRWAPGTRSATPEASCRRLPAAGRPWITRRLRPRRRRLNLRTDCWTSQQRHPTPLFIIQDLTPSGARSTGSSSLLPDSRNSNRDQDFDTTRQLGTGPFFGREALIAGKTLAENMDLSPLRCSGADVLLKRPLRFSWLGGVDVVK